MMIRVIRLIRVKNTCQRCIEYSLSNQEQYVREITKATITTTERQRGQCWFMFVETAKRFTLRIILSVKNVAQTIATNVILYVGTVSKNYYKIIALYVLQK